jgi:hypothetical protein
VILDAKEIVRSYALGQPVIEDLEARVVGKTPETMTKPWVRITLLDPQNATGINRVEHLISYYLQLDCYAGAKGGEPEAFKLAQGVRAALVEGLPEADLEGAVVTDVAALSMPHVPDDDFKPPRDRFILDVEIHMHPRP